MQLIFSIKNGIISFRLLLLSFQFQSHCLFFAFVFVFVFAYQIGIFLELYSELGRFHKYADGLMFEMHI